MTLPPQKLPFSKKTKKWRKQVLDYADKQTFFNYSLVRNSAIHKKICYDLVNGKLHMKDLELVLNPNKLKAGFIPDQIQHYPILNSKLKVLQGEEANRIFDYRVVITNPNAISEIERTKQQEIYQKLVNLITDSSINEEEFNQKFEELGEYYTYNWQDMREIRANALLQHYSKELGFKKLFNDGFMDALTVGEEIYQCDIEGGEPTIRRINPNKISVFMSGYSNRIEDADMIILEDYWSPGKIIDTFYDVLTKQDIDYIENAPKLGTTKADSMDNIDDRAAFVYNPANESDSNDYFFNPFGDSVENSLLPYDLAGNIKVLRVYWKSKRKIKKVKSYDPITGEEIYTFYDENYIIDKDKGEEETIYYINEAWEGTKIGEEIYVNMRPKVVQYNRLSNPSRCHFGIVGSIYNLNDNKPYSLVDMMKPYNYMYDVVYDRLNNLIAHNWGKIIQLDLAKVPKGWDMEKWLYYAKTNNLAVVDSFNEGMVGAATGKLAGALNNASSGVIDAEFGNSIQFHISLLEQIKNEMSEVAGISRQREGQISNRETVGGVERATLQSSHITEWLFMTHDDVKKRAIECFLETAKIALKGDSKKFQYILSDNSIDIVDLDGDEFSEYDYGLVVESDKGVQELHQKLETLAQAALQTQTLSFSTIMKLYGTNSLAEKQRMVEKDEKQMRERAQQEQQMQQQMQQETLQAKQQQAQAEMQHKDTLNMRDNETRILIANIQAQASLNNSQDSSLEINQMSLEEKARQFNERLNLDKERLAFDKSKAKTDADLKRLQINKKPNKTN